MTARPDAAARLCEEVNRAAQRPGAERKLFLDLDGTLAPIVSRPEEARVPPEALEAIRALMARGWTVAVVSGRPASNLRRMVPLRGAHLFGSHGLEGAWPGSRPPRLSASVRRSVLALLEEGRKAARGIPGARLEAKPAGVGFHDRRVSAALRPAWRNRVRGIIDAKLPPGFEVVRGKRVVEVRRAGWTKGTVVETRPGRRRVSGIDRSLLAFGDDATDEDMFRAIRSEGLGVLVAPRPRRSAARRRLRSPAQVHRFLELLARSGG